DDLTELLGGEKGEGPRVRKPTIIEEMPEKDGENPEGAGAKPQGPGRKPNGRVAPAPAPSPAPAPRSGSPPIPLPGARRSPRPLRRLPPIPAPPRGHGTMRQPNTANPTEPPAQADSGSARPAGNGPRPRFDRRGESPEAERGPGRGWLSEPKAAVWIILALI